MTESWFQAQSRVQSFYNFGARSLDKVGDSIHFLVPNFTARHCPDFSDMEKLYQIFGGYRNVKGASRFVCMFLLFDTREPQK